MLQLLQAFINLLPIHFNKYRTIIEQQPARYLRQNMIHPPFIRMAYPECAPLFQLIKLLNKLKTDKHDTIFRHEIFPEFRNFPDLRGLSRGNPRSGLIFMGEGGTINCVYSLAVFTILTVNLF